MSALGRQQASEARREPGRDAPAVSDWVSGRIDKEVRHQTRLKWRVLACWLHDMDANALLAPGRKQFREIAASEVFAQSMQGHGRR